MKNKLLYVLSMVIVFTACAKKDPGTSTGNPMVELSMTSSSSAATVARNWYHKLFSALLPSSVAKIPTGILLDSQGNVIVINSLWLSIGEIELKLTETADASELENPEISFPGPYSVNMLHDSPSSFAVGAIPLNQFRRLKYKFSKFLAVPEGAPSGVLQNALYIEGSVNGKPFVYSSSSEVEVTIAGANAVLAENSSSLLIELHLANLIKKIDFSAITATSVTPINSDNRINGTNVCPLIEASLTDLYNCVLKGFSTEANIGKDNDKDGDLDENDESVK